MSLQTSCLRQTFTKNTHLLHFGNVKCNNRLYSPHSFLFATRGNLPSLFKIENKLIDGDLFLLNTKGHKINHNDKYWIL